MKTLLTALLATAFLASPALAGDDDMIDTKASFEARDTDKDGMLSAEEYDAGEKRRYDRDRDGKFNDEERAAYDEDSKRDMDG